MLQWCQYPGKKPVSVGKLLSLLRLNFSSYPTRGVPLMLFCTFSLGWVAFLRLMTFSAAHKRSYLFFLSLSWKHQLLATAISVHHERFRKAGRNVSQFIFKVWLLQVLEHLSSGILIKTEFWLTVPKVSGIQLTFIFWKSLYKCTNALPAKWAWDEICLVVWVLSQIFQVLWTSACLVAAAKWQLVGLRFVP